MTLLVSHCFFEAAADLVCPQKVMLYQGISQHPSTPCAAEHLALQAKWLILAAARGLMLPVRHLLLPCCRVWLLG